VSINADAQSDNLEGIPKQTKKLQRPNLKKEN